MFNLDSNKSFETSVLIHIFCYKSQLKRWCFINISLTPSFKGLLSLLVNPFVVGVVGFAAVFKFDNDFDIFELKNENSLGFTAPEISGLMFKLNANCDKRRNSHLI